MKNSISSRVTNALQKSLHPSLGLGEITPELTLEAAEIIAQHLAAYGFHVCDRLQLDHGVAMTLLRRAPAQHFMVEIDVALLLIPGPDGNPSVRLALRRDSIP